MTGSTLTQCRRSDDLLDTMRRIAERATAARRQLAANPALNGRKPIRRIEEEARDALARAAKS